MTRPDYRASPGRLYGKYRGICVDNQDPMQMGRIRVTVSDVSGLSPTAWAMPCLPAAGLQNGIFAVPPIGAGVWVEFEQGEADQPIWVGGYWNAAEVPAMARMVPTGVQAFTIQTPLQNGITISDDPAPTGGILIRSSTGATISVSAAGIEISNGQGATISLTGPTVDINSGALTVV